jgi:hypothetical protein
MPLIASAAAAVLHNSKTELRNPNFSRKDKAMNMLKELNARYEAAVNAGNLELAADLASEIMSIEDASN